MKERKITMEIRCYSFGPRTGDTDHSLSVYVRRVKHKQGSMNVREVYGLTYFNK